MYTNLSRVSICKVKRGGKKWKRLELRSELNSGERRACQRDRGCTQQNAKGTAGCTQHAKSDTRHAVIVMALRMTAFVHLSNRPIVALTQNDSVHHPAPPTRVHKRFQIYANGLHVPQKTKTSATKKEKHWLITHCVIISLSTLSYALTPCKQQ